MLAELVGGIRDGERIQVDDNLGRLNLAHPAGWDTDAEYVAFYRGGPTRDRRAVRFVAPGMWASSPLEGQAVEDD